MPCTPNVSATSPRAVPRPGRCSDGWQRSVPRPWALWSTAAELGGTGCAEQTDGRKHGRRRGGGGGGGAAQKTGGARHVVRYIRVLSHHNIIQHDIVARRGGPWRRRRGWRGPARQRGVSTLTVTATRVRGDAPYPRTAAINRHGSGAPYVHGCISVCDALGVPRAPRPRIGTPPATD
jgi:hypothetical protein